MTAAGGRRSIRWGWATRIAALACALPVMSAGAQQFTPQDSAHPAPPAAVAVRAVVAPPPAPAAANATTFEAKLKKVVHDSTLANGLQVIAIENHTVPLVTVIVTVRTGAFTQAPGQEGVPHLFEHMLFKSYREGGRSWGQAISEMDAAGYNGETSDELVRYFLTVPSEKVEDGMRALAELVRDPDFTEDDLTQERRVVFDELNRDRSSPVGQLSEEVNQRLWTTSWGRKDPGGNVQSLATVTVKDLKQIFKRYYVPNNAAVIVSGDVTAERAFKLANERFGHWSRQADPFGGAPFETPPPLAKSSGIIHEQKLEDVLVMIEWQGPSTLTDPAGTYAADVLSSILDESGSSFQKHLVDNGLFASVGISYATRANVGPIRLLAHTTVDSFPRAMTALALELGQLDKSAAFTDEELDNARQSRLVGTVLELEHRTAVAQAVAEFWASAGLGYFMTYPDQLGAVSRAQISAYVDHYLGTSPFVIGVMAPPSTGQTLRPVVAGFINYQP